MEFTDDQKKAFDLAMSGVSLFLTGGAGTGKTFLLQSIIAAFKNLGKNVVVCAPTGTAAIKCGGATIHRAFGFRSGPCITSKLKLVTSCPEHIRKADVIIIDEVSMVRMDMMDSIQASIEKAGKKEQKHIQVIVCGDFYQLPPVIKETNGNGDKTGERELLERYYGRPVGRGYAFMGDGWARFGFTTVVLSQIVRQENPEFADNLNKARMGDVSCLSYFNNNSAKQALPDAVHLCGRNKDAEQVNTARQAALEGEEQKYEAYIKGEVNQLDMVVPETLELKIGARVMIAVNDINNKYHNGSTGTVIRFGYWVKGYKEIIDAGEAVTVKLDGTEEEVEIREYTWDIVRYIVKDDKVVQEIIGSYTQIPVKLAYAMTIHKSQGSTLDCVNFDPRCWAPGQLYVALSRVRDIGGLYIRKYLTASMLIVDSEVRKFYDGIERADEARLNDQRTDIAMDQPHQIMQGPEIENADVIVDESASTQVNKKTAGRPRKYRGNSHTMRIPDEIIDDVKAAVLAWSQNPDGIVIVAIPKEGAA